MKNTYKLSALLTFVFLAALLYPAAAQTTGSPKDLAKTLVGEWRNRYVRIVLVPTSGNGSRVMEADSTNWEQRLGIRPIRTHFNADGSYYSDYLNLKDSIVRRPSGTWLIQGDTLIMNEQKPEATQMKFYLTIQGDYATFHGRIDFDGEGVADDEYYGIQKRFK